MSPENILMLISNLIGSVLVNLNGKQDGTVFKEEVGAQNVLKNVLEQLKDLK